MEGTPAGRIRILPVDRSRGASRVAAGLGRPTRDEAAEVAAIPGQELMHVEDVVGLEALLPGEPDVLDRVRRSTSDDDGETQAAARRTAELGESEVVASGEEAGPLGGDGSAAGRAGGAVGRLVGMVALLHWRQSTGSPVSRRTRPGPSPAFMAACSPIPLGGMIPA